MNHISFSFVVAVVYFVVLVIPTKNSSSCSAVFQVLTMIYASTFVNGDIFCCSAGED